MKRLALLTLVALAGCHRHGDRLNITDAAHSIPADGREHLAFTLRDDHLDEVRISGAQAGSVRLDRLTNQSAAVYLRAPVLTGTLTLHAVTGSKLLRIPLTLTPDDLPTKDGTPDWMRLHSSSDQQAFRRWFTTVADRAADTPPATLPPEITDCASFIRYAYREALRAHDDRWYAQFPADSVPALPSVQQWTYPNTLLGANLFRTRPGPLQPADLSDGTFTQFADAKTLHFDNAFLVGRDLRLAKPGDLIFYRVLETNSQYHSMIITGEHGEWVVYNTGPDHGHHGEMRRVLLSDLLHHPDPQWRPEVANPNWLGVYRWNILREE